MHRRVGDAARSADAPASPNLPRKVRGPASPGNAASGLRVLPGSGVLRAKLTSILSWLRSTRSASITHDERHYRWPPGGHHGLQEAAEARGETITKEDADYCIDKALVTGLPDSNGNLNFHMRGSPEEIVTRILTTAKAWDQLMTCDQAEQVADHAIQKARWPIGNLITIGLIGISLAVTALAFVFGRR